MEAPRGVVLGLLIGLGLWALVACLVFGAWPLVGPVVVWIAFWALWGSLGPRASQFVVPPYHRQFMPDRPPRRHL